MTTYFCYSVYGCEISLICNTISAFSIPSRVDLNDSTKSFGRSVMNPIVSSIIAFYPEANLTDLELVSNI